MFENSEKKSTWGGTRPNSGRPIGSQNKATIEEKVAKEELRQRVLRNLDNLMESQLSLARGISYIYKLEDTGEGKEKKREKTLVTNPEEIREALEKIETGDFEEGEFYYITTDKPDNRALDSLLDRVFGKSKESVEHSGKIENILTKEQIDELITRRAKANNGSGEIQSD
jgi:DNA-directed RNA polymerase beta' subunit